MKRFMKKVALFLSLIALIAACVPAKQVQDLKDRYGKSEEEREYLAREKQRLETELQELQAKMELLESNFSMTKADAASNIEKVESLQKELDKLNSQKDLLEKQLKSSSSGSAEENRKIMEQLLANQERLQQREDQLKKLGKDLDDKENRLNRMSGELEKREMRVNELENLIAQKDSLVSGLKNKVMNALTGYKDKGISVEQKNGRVYVSMEAKLLFASGSTAVGTEGSKAVIDLAKALEGQGDLTILVEGHTDTDPIRSSTIKDNWDLSVMRATSIVRIMLDNSEIDPLVLTAAGRGEHFPIADNKTAEGKAKNRRIEVILTPNLDKLFEILEEAQSPR